MLDIVGKQTIAAVRNFLVFLSIALSAVCVGLIPRTWRRTVRSAVAIQIAVVGAGSLGVVCFFGFVVGLFVIVEYQAWLGTKIESKYLSQLFVVVVFRELGPLLVNVIVVGRCGSQLCSELGLMTALGEVRSLSAQGLDTLSYLIVPRVYGFVFSVACLTAIFSCASLVGAFICGQWTGAKIGTLETFAHQTLSFVSGIDVFNIAAKGILPPWLAATYCSLQGLRTDRRLTDVPLATARGVQGALVIVVLVSGVISVVSYV